MFLALGNHLVDLGLLLVFAQNLLGELGDVRKLGERQGLRATAQQNGSQHQGGHRTTGDHGPRTSIAPASQMPLPWRRRFDYRERNLADSPLRKAFGLAQASAKA